MEPRDRSRNAPGLVSSCPYVYKTLPFLFFFGATALLLCCLPGGARKRARGFVIKVCARKKSVFFALVRAQGRKKKETDVGTESRGKNKKKSGAESPFFCASFI